MENLIRVKFSFSITDYDIYRYLKFKVAEREQISFLMINWPRKNCRNLSLGKYNDYYYIIIIIKYAIYIYTYKPAQWREKLDTF